MDASIQSPQAANSVDLLSTLRQREAQVALLRAAYSAAMARDGMSWWIATAASELRKSEGRLMVHVAAQLSTAESAISRFERHINFPRDIDTTVRAYADDLGTRPIEIWTRALELWREDELAIERDAAGDPAAVVTDVVAQVEAAAGSRQQRGRAGSRNSRADTKRKTA